MKKSIHPTNPGRIKENLERRTVARTKTLSTMHLLPLMSSATSLVLAGTESADRATSPSPHSPAQPYIVQRYGRAEYVGVVGAG